MIFRLFRNGYQILKSTGKRRKFGELISEVEDAFLKSIDFTIDQVNDGKIISSVNVTVKINSLTVLLF